MVGLIPLGVIIATALGAGKRGSLVSGEPNSLNKKTTANKQEMIFLANLLGASANADGNISKEESNEINKVLDDIFQQFKIETDIMGIMKDRVMNPITIKQLRESYRALDNVSDEKKENYRNIVQSIIASDAALTLPEQVFQYKVELMLADLPNMPIYTFDETVQCNNSDVLTILKPSDVKTKFRETKQKKFISDMVYTHHPATNEELVPISLFFDENFAQDKDTELVRIAQMAGAKKVSIHAYSKDSDDTSKKVDVSAGATYKVVTGEIAVKTAIGDISEMETKTSLQFTFEGRKSSNFIAGMIDQHTVLNKTKWLKADPKLSAFVESCFGKNKVKSFDWDIEYTEIGNSMLSAAVAAKCKLPGLSANLKTSYEAKAAKYTQRKNRYQIEF